MIVSSEASESTPNYFNIENTKENDQLINSPASCLAAQARTAFIVKVYCILIHYLVELIITFGMCLLAQYVQAYQQFQLSFQWVLIFPVVLIIASMIVAMCVSKAREYPFDMILLFFFIISYGYIISFACSAVKQTTQGPVVVIAVIITLVITIAITVYAFFAKINYRILFGILIVVSLTAIMVLIVALISMTSVLISIYCGLAVILYGIYLVVITKMIIGGDQNMIEFPLDNYLIASILLYLYIMKIFLMILRIVSSSKN